MAPSPSLFLICFVGSAFCLLEALPQNTVLSGLKTLDDAPFTGPLSTLVEIPALHTSIFREELTHNGDRPVCSVAEFGAAGNGTVFDTEAIQRAIDSCSDRGGGIVFVPPGNYLTGTIYLKSHTILHVTEGATIIGSPNQQDYPVERSRWYVILAENATNVGITGGGTIHGQAYRFVVQFKENKNVMVSWNTTGACFGDECRPRLIGFVNCKHVHIWNIHFEEPAYWCLHLLESNAISVHNVSIHGDFNIPNNDGIDIESSNNTVITRCHIDTGDDAISPKTSTGPLYNLTVSHCWIRTKSCGVKLGSATYFNFHKLMFTNIDIVDSHRGLGLQLRDSGNIFDVTFSNIRISTRYYDPSWWGNSEPIYVTACPRTPSTVVGSISNVKFLNITAVSENGIFLAGSSGSLLRNIIFESVYVQLKRWTKDKGGLFDYRPGCQGLVQHRNSGIFMEYISNLAFHNVSLLWEPTGQLSVLPLDFNVATVGTIKIEDFISAVADI